MRRPLRIIFLPLLCSSSQYARSLKTVQVYSGCIHFHIKPVRILSLRPVILREMSTFSATDDPVCFQRWPFYC